LPKEKDLVCRDETRHFIEKEGWSKYGYGEDGEGKKIGLYLPLNPPYKRGGEDDGFMDWKCRE
jgi:hypothetical protein